MSLGSRSLHFCHCCSSVSRHSPRLGMSGVQMPGLSLAVERLEIITTCRIVVVSLTCIWPVVGQQRSTRTIRNGPHAQLMASRWLNVGFVRAHILFGISCYSHFLLVPEVRYSHWRMSALAIVLRWGSLGRSLQYGTGRVIHGSHLKLSNTHDRSKPSNTVEICGRFEASDDYRFA